MKILITGAAGFIGFHAAIRELDRGNTVIGVDNLNSYYERRIKIFRIKNLKKYKKFIFLKNDLLEKKFYKNIKKYYSKISCIIHLAGQAGVRYSITNPEAYIKQNILAYIKLLEFFKMSKKLKLVLYASSSSVYGEKVSNKNSLYPASKPISVYAASKISMELISNAYCHLYKKNLIGLRFFTVYGPWGRPDMSYFKFFNLASRNKSIAVFNYGNHSRSFTYIDDLINNMTKIKNYYLAKNNKKAESHVYNLGNPKTVTLKYLIKTMEIIYGKNFKKKYIAKQPGDVLNTAANLIIEKKKFKLKFSYNLERGLKNFYFWFKKYKNY